MEERQALKDQIRKILKNDSFDSDLSDISEESNESASIISGKTIRSGTFCFEGKSDLFLIDGISSYSMDDTNISKHSGRSARVINLQETQTVFQQMKKAQEDLMYVVESNDVKGLFLLIEKNTFIDLNTPGLNNWTPLHVASARGYKDICKILLSFSKSVDINSKTSIGRTALHLSCIHNHLKIVLLLLSHGCDINAQDDEKNLPIHYAASLGNEDVVEALLQARAKTDLANHLNRKPLDLSLNIHTYNIFLAYTHIQNLPCLTSSYSRTVFNESLRHNSREDHISQILLKSSKAHRLSDLKLFENRPKLPVKTREKLVIDLPAGKVGPKDFKVICQLGKGSFGFVYLVQHLDSKCKYALKVLDKAQIFQRKLEKYAFTERNILMKLDHPFIVKLHFAFQTPEKLALVMDFCPNGDLGMLLQREKTLTEEAARFYICEIVLALQELHSHNIVFRDLKPDNILIGSDGHIRLTDFGLSRDEFDPKTLAQSFCGSAAYFAPEMVKRQGHSFSIDWYVLGAILYEMVIGTPPYYSVNRSSLYRNIKKAKLLISDALSEEIRDLILKLLVRNPKKRLGAGKKAALEIMKHRFFDGVDWKMVLNKEIEPPKFKSVQRIEKDIELEKVYGKLSEDNGEDMDVKNWSFLEGRC